MDFNNEISPRQSQQLSDASADANIAKSIQEVQASLVIAKKFPRNIAQAYTDLIDECKITSLAEEAQYTYPRGGMKVTGASIRLAEVLARNYENITLGFKELSRDSIKGESEVEAFCWDLQKNVKITRTFKVGHFRDSRAKGKQRLTDDRDINEMISNQAQRRVRACILSVIPKHFQEDAINQCNATLGSSDIPLSERVKKLSVAFDAEGVTVEMIETRLKHSLDAINEDELVGLRGIYKSMKDGMSNREDWFEFSAIRSNAAVAFSDAVANTVAKIESKKTEKTKEK